MSDDFAPPAPARPGGSVLITAACVIIIVAGLKVAGPVLILVALALFLAVVLRPAITWMQRHRVPIGIAIPLAMLFTFGVIAAFVSVATQSLAEIRVAFPRYVTRYQAMELAVVDWLRQRNIELPPGTGLDLVNMERGIDIATTALRSVAGILTSTVLVLIVAIFAMLEANGLPRKLRGAFGWSFEIGRLSNIVHQVQHYLAIKTVISLITGLLIGLWVWLIGLDFPLFWGMIAFLLNFVPNVGSIVAAIPAILLGLIQIGPNGAILTAIGYVGVNIALGNFVEPMLLGRRLGLSPLVVILSLLFWGWMWGPVGILLSVPLTMSLRIMLENTQDYRWLAVLLAPSSAAVEPAGGAPAPPAAAVPPREVERSAAP
jgi:AI-2 transport protein TqsA